MSTFYKNTGFLENEGCINSVLSTPKWKCDINYERVIKNNRNWKKDLNSICRQVF